MFVLGWLGEVVLVLLVALQFSDTESGYYSKNRNRKRGRSSNSKRKFENSSCSSRISLFSNAQEHQYFMQGKTTFFIISTHHLLQLLLSSLLTLLLLIALSILYICICMYNNWSFAFLAIKIFLAIHNGQTRDRPFFQHRKTVELDWIFTTASIVTMPAPLLLSNRPFVLSCTYWRRCAGGAIGDFGVVGIAFLVSTFILVGRLLSSTLWLWFVAAVDSTTCRHERQVTVFACFPYSPCNRRSLQDKECVCVLECQQYYECFSIKTTQDICKYVYSYALLPSYLLTVTHQKLAERKYKFIERNFDKYMCVWESNWAQI